MQAVFLSVVFVCYTLLLMKIVFFSRISPLELFHSQRTLVRSINLIPFHSIMEYVRGNSEDMKAFAFGNVIGNIVMFVPLGLYLPLLRKTKSALPNLLVVFLVSLFVEVVQGFMGIGTADVDDIILNGLGGWIGIVGYKLLLLALRGEKRVRTAVTILSVIGLPAILYLLFMMRMSF